MLNGTATITIEGKDHSLVAGEFLVVDSNQIHEAQCARVSMMVVIHYSRAIMKNYMSKIDEYRIHCSRQTLKKEKLDKYLEMHIYHDLCSTGEGVMELSEKHGFANYKLFNRMFREIYGCKPSDVRKK